MASIGISKKLRIVLSLLACAIILPTQAHPETGAQVLVRFTDASTGYSVLPTDISLRHTKNGVSKTLTTQQLQSIGFTSLRLEEGVWEVHVQAAGFQPMNSRIAVVPNISSTIEFFLDPISTPEELKPDHIAQLHRNDATLVLGFIVDDQTGLPLKDVVVRSTADKRQVRSDERGFYRIYLPLASNSITPNLQFQKSGYQTEVRQNIETWTNGDWIQNIRLKIGSGSNIIDESKSHRPVKTEKDESNCINCEKQDPSTGDILPTSVVLPASIRVGRNCTGTSCTTVQVYSLETYAKYVLPAEWYSCWGSLSNGMNSLQAGAVAIRSYGLWYVYNPLSASYDICDNTSCQVFGSSQSTNANNAVDATSRYILLTSSSSVARSEYAAENNNKGCGDGWTGTGSSWPCTLDMVCQGQTSNGHGRGVCQWGTVRWGSGTRVLTTSPCAAGVSHGLGTLTWQQILSHYYPSYTLIQGSTATIQSATPNPATVAQGSTFTIEYSINTTDAMSLILAASIAPTGTTTYTSDPAHDLKVSLFEGPNVVSRTFRVSASQTTGSHDLLVAVWYDKNNNNIIDAGDFVVNSQQYNSALTITVLPIQLASFTATVVNGNDVRLDWRTLSEINNFGFFVQRRLQTVQTYEEIPNSFVAGNGTTNIPHDYSFTNINVGNGNWFYRLRQVDLDGTPHFTDPVQANVVTSVAENTPIAFGLSQNYPNPFNPVTNFQFSIVNSQLTILKVFDILGREVATLVNEPLSAGMHTVSWDATGIPTGVYTYRLTSGSNTASKRLVLIR
jgi:hypothetical protein